jgi:hypothetical protein
MGTTQSVVSQGYNKDDPVINNNLIKFERFKTLYAIDEVKDIFLKKQLRRTLWIILRGTVLDAFNRHSLQPVPLPWVV